MIYLQDEEVKYFHLLWGQAKPRLQCEGSLVPSQLFQGLLGWTGSSFAPQSQALCSNARVKTPIQAPWGNPYSLSRISRINNISQILSLSQLQHLQTPCLIKLASRLWTMGISNETSYKWSNSSSGCNIIKFITMAAGWHWEKKLEEKDPRHFHLSGWDSLLLHAKLLSLKHSVWGPAACFAQMEES